MNLLCCETSVSSCECRAYPDPTLLNDDRVLKHLLRTEERYVASSSYFQRFQTDLTPHMRKIVAEWMLELCEEQKCQEEVFLLAINYLDRFLNVCPIRKTQLQLLGTACLLVSSKMREPQPLSAESLVQYTGNSIELEDLWRWEMLVLSKLKWDVAATTPRDFLPHILRRLPLDRVPSLDPHKVHVHAQTFITLCFRDHKFSMYTASMIAGASVAAALHGLKWTHYAECSLTELLEMLQRILSIETDILHSCLDQIEEMIVSEMREANPPNVGAGAQSAGAGASGGSSSQASASGPQPTKPESAADKTVVEHSQAGTPTDVRDVHF
ncbi:G1/S-specific cyclin-D2 [Nilaparvata lugens]|uniref:G1/S-specific cyclin-D2 n=1 Tax=Nilaparvata lugens TaxID=108931 RepID=UPI00193DF9B7|nr:G1/S-specific cyclin-D2 [Nilaparvata lugens]